jgi:hypothetical protein
MKALKFNLGITRVEIRETTFPRTPLPFGLLKLWVKLSGDYEKIIRKGRTGKHSFPYNITKKRFINTGELCRQAYLVGDKLKFGFVKNVFLIKSFHYSKSNFFFKIQYKIHKTTAKCFMLFSNNDSF